MGDRETTVRSRELGAGLRRLVKEAGLNGKSLAQRLDWSESDVSRLLNGKRAVRETDVAALLGACGAKTVERERLLRLCRDAARLGWWQQHGTRLPHQLRTLIDHEDNALAIGEYQATLVPGLLQTGDYARNVISRIVNIPAGEVDDRIAARLARQSIFGRIPGAHYTYFVHEFVLRLPVGSANVMSEQLHHLLRMSVRRYLDLRVVPVAAGAHAGVAGSFSFMEFAEITPVVYLESETSTLFLEESAEISAYRHILTDLAGTALDARQSQELIRNLAVELYGSEDDDDI
jgi:transcriptional regulator with XRE-family HTH domain